jgi:RHS repeat-associated protein
VGDIFTNDNLGPYSDMLTEQTDPSKPKAYLNYILFDENMKMVSEMSGAFQATGDGAWTQIGTETAMEILKNGYLAIYLSNSSQAILCKSCSDVYFDQLVIKVSHGTLLEENHYYPFGLPIAGLGSVTADGQYKENRRKYQSNEYITKLNLNWMSFGARQYDPQIGRFLNVDPLANFGDQDMFSPFAAMGNTPESSVDPGGLAPLETAQAITPENDARLNAFGSAQAFMRGGNSSAGATYGGGGSTAPNFPPNFNSNGIGGIALNMFWDILPPAIKQQADADYGSFVATQGFIKNQTAINNGRYGGYQTSDVNALGDVQINWNYGRPYHGGGSTEQSRVEWNNRLYNLSTNSFPAILLRPQYLYHAYTFIGNMYERLSRANTGLSDLAYLASLGNNIKVARIGEAASYQLFFTATTMDGVALANGKITPTKFGVNLGFGLLGFTEYGAPISAIYFSVDAFAPNGWQGGGEVPDPPAGYENVNIANIGN